MWFITLNFWGGLARVPSPGVRPECDEDWASPTSRFTGDLIISALRSLNHTSLRDAGRNGRAAWHPARTGCGAEAASDNTSCWECRQPLVHLFSPLNHCSPNRKLLPRHFIYLSCSPHSFIEVLSLNFKLLVRKISYSFQRKNVNYHVLQRSVSALRKHLFIFERLPVWLGPVLCTGLNLKMSQFTAAPERFVVIW